MNETTPVFPVTTDELLPHINGERWRREADVAHAWGRLLNSLAGRLGLPDCRDLKPDADAERPLSWEPRPAWSQPTIDLSAFDWTASGWARAIARTARALGRVPDQVETNGSEVARWKIPVDVWRTADELGAFLAISPHERPAFVQVRFLTVATDDAADFATAVAFDVRRARTLDALAMVANIAERHQAFDDGRSATALADDGGAS